MGNLAVKCESQWQERKAIASCVGATVDVRVMKADGTMVEEFDRPVLVYEVMSQFPDYVVVQWCPWRNSKLGKRGQLRVLQQHDVLTRGQIYILFPIPTHVVKNTNRRSRHMQSAKDRLSLLLRRAEMTATTTTDASTQQPLLNDQQSLSEDSKPLVRKETSGNEEEQKSQKPNVCLQPCFNNWRPALLSIPESPIGFHSRPEAPSPLTPKTPIAFRLVSSREQGR